MKRLAILVILLLCLCGCQKEQAATSKTLNTDGVKSMKIAILPSPPQAKTVDGEKDIEAVINHINAIDKKEIDLGDVNGWEILIQTYDENEVQKNAITFLAHYISIDDVWYEVSEVEMEKMRELYNDLQYEEYAWK